MSDVDDDELDVPDYAEDEDQAFAEPCVVDLDQDDEPPEWPPAFVTTRPLVVTRRRKPTRPGAANMSGWTAIGVGRADGGLRRISYDLDQDPRAASIAFGRRLRAVRDRREMSQDQLADATEVHPTAIGRLERGAREPRLTTILRLARGLEVRPGELVDGLE
jgi:DNA-binding XRE family transcriptional regulator